MDPSSWSFHDMRHIIGWNELTDRSGRNHHCIFFSLSFYNFFAMNISFQSSNKTSDITARFVVMKSWDCMPCCVVIWCGMTLLINVNIISSNERKRIFVGIFLQSKKMTINDYSYFFCFLVSLLLCFLSLWTSSV